jgi:hypothetical protein
MLTQIAQTTSKYDVHHEGTKDTKDLGINSLTLNFVLFAIFVVKTQASTLVAALPPWVLRGEVSLAILVAALPHRVLCRDRAFQIPGYRAHKRLCRSLSPFFIFYFYFLIYL